MKNQSRKCPICSRDILQNYWITCEKQYCHNRYNQIRRMTIEKPEKPKHKNEVYKAWVCSCEEGWIIPCEYTHCGKCGASDHFNASTKERNIIMPPWYIEAQ